MSENREKKEMSEQAAGCGGAKPVAERDVKYAVICIGCDDAYVYRLELFEGHEEAVEFMLEDVQRFLEECDYGLSKNLYPDEAVLSEDDDAVYHWVIKAASLR